MSIFWGLGYALNVITYGLHMSLKEGGGVPSKGWGVLNFSLLANGGLRVSYVGLMSFVGRRFEVHNNMFLVLMGLSFWGIWEFKST